MKEQFQYSPINYRKQKYALIGLFLLSLSVLGSCGRRDEGSAKAALEITRTVTANTETAPVPQGVQEDSADDPAIWIHPTYPDSSRIIGTDKKGGLIVYDLQGNQLKYYPVGLINNADLRYAFPLQSDTIDVLAVSNRSTQSVDLYRIAPDGSLEVVHREPFKSKMKDEVYGLCMYKSPLTGKFFLFVNSKGGEVEQWELKPDQDKINGEMVRTLKFATQTEGMVADDSLASLFIGEEKTGIWKIGAEPNDSVTGLLLAESTEKKNKNIRFDIEGLAIYYLDHGKGYLVASSQGNHSYALFSREAPHNYLGSFRIVDGPIDGVEETDGLEISSNPLGTSFPNGLIVIQDGFNKEKGIAAAQNFKLLRWDSVANLFNPPLMIR